MKAKDIITRFTLLGFIVGFIFPVFALVLDMVSKGLSITFDNVVKLHEVTPIHYIIDFAPLVLAATAYFVGKYILALKAELSTKLEVESSRPKKFASYINTLIEGNYDAKCDEADNEIVGVFNKLKNTLKEYKEREKRQLWTTEGLTKFIAVLRSDEADLKSLCNEIIVNLVKYIKANQGSIYILDEEGDDQFLNLMATYAYDSKKFQNKRIEPGEGLLGQVFKEKETVLLKEVPQGYVTITSGLGESTPACILIIPLLLNEELVGVIELAGFKVFEDYEVEFTEKLGENIAAAVSGIKTAEITKTLLQEAQYNTEQMRSQEEEMRQNMEELTATQEEIERKEKEYQQRILELEAKLK